jgi:hypothetical protein
MSPVPSKPHSEIVRPSARKLTALRQLENLGLKVSGECEYLPHDATIPELTLVQVREALACIKEPLAQTVIDERRRS